MHPLIYVAIIAFLLLLCFTTIPQASVGVITMFGKYRRVMYPGLNFKLPLIETVFKKVSTQNRSADLEFQAITLDQANVYFKTMLLYSVIDQKEETIKNVTFKFLDDRNFMSALIRTVEGTIRAFVATKKQAEILSVRSELVEHVKAHLDPTLEQWGYHLIDLQLNDITFDDTIMKSMAQVVSSNNLKAAAENEGQALLITKTKQAEAEGNAIRIAAQAEKEAAQLRGQGVALFREEVAKGMSTAAKEMQDANLDASMILFSMWTESIKHFAENGKGNVIFLDGSSENMSRTMKELMAMQQMEKFNK